MNKYIVKFARGPKEGYNLYSTEQKKSIVYFSEDTNEIIVNSTTYGVNLKAEDVELISKVEMTSIGTIVFTRSNGSKITISIPVATIDTDGLLSKEDKQIIDNLPEVYATKEELKNSISQVYRFRGTKQFYDDLPTENLVIGDAYNILNPFTIGDEYYSAGTNVAWDGSQWDPLGGTTDCYSKLEADDKFIAWALEEEVKVVKLPKGSKVLATQLDGTNSNLISLGGAGADETVEVGDVQNKLNLSSKGRPSIILPDGEQQSLAYLSDIGGIDLDSYPANAQLLYIPEVSQEFLDENVGDKFNGNPITSTNKPVAGEDYMVVLYFDVYLVDHVDYFSPKSVMPATVHAVAQGLREEYLDMFTWEIINQ